MTRSLWYDGLNIECGGEGAFTLEKTGEARSLSDRIAQWMMRLLRLYRAPVMGSLIFGFAAHMYMITNKLVNWDDIRYMFTSGVTMQSGRWVLPAINAVFPPYSMPWLLGTIAIVLLCVASCMIVRMFAIRNKVLQFLLAAGIVTFPSVTGAMGFMFTVHCFALAFVLSVCAAMLYQGGARSKLLALTLAVCMMGIYQAFISVIASLFVVLLIQEILKNEKQPLEILKTGLGYVLFLLAAMAIYYAITNVAMRMAHVQFGMYASARNLGILGSIRSLPQNIVRTYYAFAKELLGRYYGLALTPWSALVHTLCAGFTGILLLIGLKNCRPAWNRVLLLVLILLLPVAVNSLYLVVEPAGMNTMTQYSFVCLYVLAAVSLEALPARRARAVCRDILGLALAFIIATNVYMANCGYLQMHFEYENTYALYTSVATQIESTPGFSEDSVIALVGDAPLEESLVKGFGRVKARGIANLGSVRNDDSRDRFFNLYLGMNLKFASEREVLELQQDPRVRAMNCYPYYGYVQKIDDYIVVKLGED